MNENITWTYCSHCKHQTKNTILYVKEVKGFLDEYFENFQVVECNGCETVSFRKELHDFWEHVTDENGDHTHKVTITTYPNNLEGHAPLDGLYHLPSKIKGVYQQTILAFQGNSLLLAGVGFRAIIEAICIEEQIKGGNLEQKINNLSKNRLITEKEAERLHSIRFLGNDSVHEMEIPKEHKLFLVLDIIENLLKNIYIIDKQAKSVLDTIIKDYPDFESLLWKCVEKQSLTEEKTLKQIFGKHLRRINIDLTIAEKTIIDSIQKGAIEFLKLGSLKTLSTETMPTQHYFYTGKQFEEFPF